MSNTISRNFELPMSIYCIGWKGYNARLFGALMIISEEEQINSIDNYI